MKYAIKCIASKGVNVRSEPSASATDLGDLNFGQVAEGDVLHTDAAGNDWLLAKKVNGQDLTGYVAMLYNGVQLCEFVTPSGDPAPAPADQTFTGVLTDAAGVQYQATVTIKKQ